MKSLTIGSCFLIAISLLAILLAGNLSPGRARSGRSFEATRPPEVTVLCAASLAPAMDDIKRAFEADHHATVRVNYQGSAQLVSLFRISAVGDVLIAADQQYHQPLIDDGLCEPPQTIGFQTPCLVGRANATPSQLTLTQGDAIDRLMEGRSSIPKPDHAAIGRRIANQIGTDRYDDLLARATVSRETVSQVATDVDQGFADWGIAWNTSSRQFNNVRRIEVKEWVAAGSQIGVSRLRSARRRDGNVDSFADALVGFIAGPRGQAILQRHGCGRKELPDVQISGLTP